MVIYLAGETEEQEVRLDELTPRQIVAELDKHVVGQKAAKRAVAIALRNRVRRKKLAGGSGRRCHPKEHHHDWIDRCRQNRDRPPPGSHVQLAIS